MTDAAPPANGREARIKFLADPAFIEALREELLDEPSVEVSEIREERDPTNLAFDIGDVNSILALVTFAFFDGPLIVKMVRAMKRSKPKEIVLKTPGRTVRIEYTEDLTEADVKALVQRATGLL